MSGGNALNPMRAHAQAMSLLLAGSLCLLPFLLPYHQPPLLSFQPEWLAAALGVAAMITALAGRRAAFTPIPLPARWLLLFALFLALQALLSKPAYPQLPLFGALYVLYAALLVWLGAQLSAAEGLERSASVLAACLLAGALANAVAGMIQFYGRPALLQDFIAELHRDPLHNGVYGNIAQSNLYANYLALGASALLFLWLRGGLRPAFALAAAALLAWAGALSGSRGALFYPLWLAAFAFVAGRNQAGAQGQRFSSAAFGLAGLMLAAQVLVPWMNEAFQLGPANQGAFERLVEISTGHTEARGPLWLLAWRIFAAAPIAGAGIGEFAGAAFSMGLPHELARIDNVVWTSPHNLPLQLLAETGALGAVLALGGVCAWCWQALRRCVAAPDPAMWWITAAVGIELIHSMFEFPLWNAHFLGVTALLIGVGARPRTGSKTASRLSLAAATLACAALVLALAVLLRDHARLDETYVTGTTITLSSPADVARDAAVMRALTHGPFAPAAELWIFRGTALNHDKLAAKLGMSERVARHFPSDAVIARRVVFLAFDGRTAEAHSLLAQALRTFPQRCRSTRALLQEALLSDRTAIEPLIAQVKNHRSCV